ARDYCSPNPLLEPAVFPWDAGFLLAVNVWPFPGQAVAVRTGSKDKQLYVFPFRSGTQTKFLEAEQLPMLMLPQLRKAAIVLAHIPVGKLVRIIDQGGQGNIELYLDGIFAERNCFRLKGQGSGKGVGDVQKLPDGVTLPLDVVDLVWEEKGRWQLAIRGQL